MVAKLSSARTTSAASWPPRCPCCPSLRRRRRFSAGASLTRRRSSPPPRRWPAGPAPGAACARGWRGRTSTPGSTSRRRWSSSNSISAPVSAGRSMPIPSMAPIARAVSTWSPVIIFTAIPAAWHSATAARAADRCQGQQGRHVGEIQRALLRRHRPPGDGQQAGRERRCRWPGAASNPGRATAPSRPPAQPRTCRGCAPARPSGRPSPGPRGRGAGVAMKRCSDSNGIASLRGRSAASACGSRPSEAEAEQRAFGGVALQLPCLTLLVQARLVAQQRRATVSCRSSRPADRGLRRCG